MKDFEYVTPKTLREAVTRLSEKNGNARVLAGGTDLIVQMRIKRAQPERVVDVKSIPELNELSYGPKRGLRVGAAVPCWRIYNDPDVVERYPAIFDSTAIIGGIQIQGRASIGGNLCNSSPSADSTPTMIAYGATCDIVGPKGKRQVPVAGFCTGPGTNVLAPDELLVAINFPPARKFTGAHYLRFIPRNEMDIAVVGAGAFVELANRKKDFKIVRIALGAVAPMPVVAEEAAKMLEGRAVSDEAIEEAAEAAKAVARPITDMRGTAEYRTHLVGVLTKRALHGAVKRARGEFVPNAVQEPSSN